MSEQTGTQGFRVQGDTLVDALRGHKVVAKNREGRCLLDMTVLLAVILTVLMPHLALVFAAVVLLTGGSFILQKADETTACC